MTSRYLAPARLGAIALSTMRMGPPSKQQRVERWALLSLVIGLIGWGLFEFVHDATGHRRSPPIPMTSKRNALPIRSSSRTQCPKQATTRGG